MYAWGLNGVARLRCASDDPHCEGPVEASAPQYELANGSSIAGTGEPMTVIAISWYNMLHPAGYRPPLVLRALARDPATRVVQSRFLAQNVTANGLEARFGDSYNFITPDYAIGSASQPYITNTHSKYYPNVEDKLVTILLGAVPGTPPFVPLPGLAFAEHFRNGSMRRRRESPQITLVGDFRVPGNPYNAGPEIRNHGVINSHLALHIGAVQHREALLLTSALDADDALQWQLTPTGNKFAALTTNLILPADATGWAILFPNGSASSQTFIDPSIGQLALGEIEIPILSTVCLRIGGAALAVKVFELDGVHGQDPSLRLVADLLGRQLNAARLVCQHFHASAPEWINGSAGGGRHARFAALVVAGSTAGDGEASMNSLCGAVHTAETSSVITSSGEWVVRAEASVIDAQMRTKQVARARSNEARNFRYRAPWRSNLARKPVALAIGRDLSCSNGGVRNQSVHTSWNCLTFRSIDGNPVSRAAQPT